MSGQSLTRFGSIYSITRFPRIFETQLSDNSYGGACPHEIWLASIHPPHGANFDGEPLAECDLGRIPQR